MQLAAEWILPVTAPPIADGVIEINGGTIRTVGPRSELPDGEDLGPAVILPGLVNAHTHLEMGHMADLAGPPSGELSSWLHQVLSRQLTLAADELDRLAAQAAQAGAVASMSAGITTVGDVTQRPAATRPVL